ncbi:cation-transporting P-type ATPase [Candidatus Saccharibacteria bacterium]|nr:cation-transporting P-type ATPase [Candidatus Saccharibacteria bacterium]
MEQNITGLSSAEARANLKKYGENAFAKEKFSALKSLLGQFLDILNLILVGAAVLSFSLGEHTDAIVILTIVVLNALLSFSQEFRSEKAVERLSDLIKHEVLVIRDSKQVIINVEELVPSDAVILRGGDVVPADIKILSSNDLSVNESQLTGESVPIEKSADSKDAKNSQLFTGSIIERGYCTGEVYATGNKTELGKIALLSKNTKKITPFQKSLSEFSIYLLRIIGATIVLMLAAKAFSLHNVSDWANTVLFTIALAITVVPEALPMITTISLSSGAIKLARHKVVVKRLSAIEDLGRINILCTDKTGTLTQDKLSITEITSDNELMFQRLAVTTMEDAKVKNHSLHSFDRAFADYVPKNIQSEVGHWKQLDSLPFDPPARRRRVIVEDPDNKKHYLVVIGALETLLDLCNKPKKDFVVAMDEAAKSGKRQLALAYREIDYQPDFNIIANEKNLTFLGFANMIDPLRPTAKRTIDHAKALGIDVKILTGDSVEVASYIGKEIGLIDETHRVYSGDEVAKMTIPELNKAITECSVFARVTPEQKYNIIQQLKIHNVVGYQGDGINDAPSLKLADASIAVNNATDVAKDSADIILLEENLEVVIDGVRYGRSIFVNINNYIKHAMVGDLGNFFSLAVFYVIFSADLPMLPIQLLIANLIQDFPHLTIASDNVDKKSVEKPLVAGRLKSLMKTSLILGVFTAIFYLGYFIFVGTAATDLTRTNLFVFFNLTQLFVILSVRKEGFFWQGAKPSSLLLSALFLFAIGSVALIYVPVLSELLGFAPLPLRDIAILIAVTITFFLVLDFIKVGINKLWAKREQIKSLRLSKSH